MGCTHVLELSAPLFPPLCSALAVASSVVHAAAVRDALAQLAAGGGAGAPADAADGGRADFPLALVDAFAVPRVVFDPVRRAFHRCAHACAWRGATRARRGAPSPHGSAPSVWLRSAPAPPRVLAAAECKVSLYRERFNLVSQRLARSKLFSRPALGAAASMGLPAGSQCELTPLQALLGTAGATRFVLGALSLLDDGRYWLEDATGAVAVDLSRAATAAGLFTENCVVVAEGELRRDGVFEARA
jgi:DNA polymerase epsilon subunit 2